MQWVRLLEEIKTSADTGKIEKIAFVWNKYSLSYDQIIPFLDHLDLKTSSIKQPKNTNSLNKENITGLIYKAMVLKKKAEAEENVTHEGFFYHLQMALESQKACLQLNTTPKEIDAARESWSKYLSIDQIENNEEKEKFNLFKKYSELRELQTIELAKIAKKNQQFQIILGAFKQKLHAGNSLLIQKRYHMDVHTMVSAEGRRTSSLKLIDDAIGNPNFSLDQKTLWGLINRTQKLIDEAEYNPITLKTIEQLGVDFNDIAQSKILTPLKKYDVSRNFLIRICEWISDTLKTLFSFHYTRSLVTNTTYSTKKTLSIVSDSLINFFKDAKKCANLIDEEKIELMEESKYTRKL